LKRILIYANASYSIFAQTRQTYLKTTSDPLGAFRSGSEGRVICESRNFSIPQRDIEQNDFFFYKMLSFADSGLERKSLPVFALLYFIYICIGSSREGNSSNIKSLKAQIFHVLE